MKPEELKAILQEVYGDKSQRRFAKEIGKGEVAVSRWMQSVTPIEEAEALTIRLLLLLHRRKIAWRKWLSDYEKHLGNKVNLEEML